MQVDERVTREYNVIIGVDMILHNESDSEIEFNFIDQVSVPIKSDQSSFLLIGINFEHSQASSESYHLVTYRSESHTHIFFSFALYEKVQNCNLQHYTVHFRWKLLKK